MAQRSRKTLVGAERLMGDAGLALGLSDRTTMVGERAARQRT